MSSNAIPNDDAPNSNDSNCDYDSIINNLENLEGFNLVELKDVIEKGLKNVFAVAVPINEETELAESQNCTSDKAIEFNFAKSAVNSIKSNSNWSCVGRRSSSIKSVSFKDVIDDDISSRADEYSGKGDEPLSPYDGENSELFKKFVVRIAEKNSNSTERFSDMDNLTKEGCIQTDSFHSILKHDEFDEMAISETLLALIDQKNKYISHLQNKVHNQKVQLQFYLQKTLNNSTIKALSQTCDPYVIEDNINLNFAMKRFCKQEGVKTTLMQLHEHMAEVEGNIYDILDTQDAVIQEMAKVLQSSKDDGKHSSSMVMRSMSRKLGNTSYYECLQKNYFSLLTLRREMFHFRNSCDKILSIEEERNRIVEQVYSLPADQRINCNILASIQFDKFRIEEEFERIKEEQKRIENRLYIGEHLEKYFKCMADDGVVNVPLQKNKIDEYLERQLETANSDGLALLTIIHKQKAKYTQELHTLFLANRQLTEKVEQLQQALQERELLLQKFMYERHSNDKSDVSLSDSNIFSSQRSKSGLVLCKKKGSLASELEEQLQALGNKLQKENTDRGKLEIELSLRSTSEYKADVSQRFDEKSLRLNDNTEKIISNKHHKWKLRAAEAEFDKKLTEILEQKEEYLQDIKDLTKIVKGQELQIKHLLVIIDKLRPHLETREQEVHYDPPLEMKNLTQGETQTNDPPESKVELKETYVQTMDQGAPTSKPKHKEMRSVIDVLRDCAENVKTIFRTTSSDYSLRSSLKRQPEIRFATQTSDKLTDLPEKYIGSNNTTCIEQLPKEDDSKSETLPHSCPLVKPFKCLRGLMKHKSESIIAIRNKHQAIIDNINASFKSNEMAGLLQLLDLQSRSKHITFSAEIHEAPTIQHADISQLTSEERISGSYKKEEEVKEREEEEEEEEEGDVNQNPSAKPDVEESQNVSSFDLLSTVNESNESKSNEGKLNEKSTDNRTRRSSSSDNKKSSESSKSNQKNKVGSSKKSDRSSTESARSQQRSSASRQQSSKSIESTKQQKQSSSSENEKKSFNSSTTVRKKPEIHSYDYSLSEKSFKNQEFIVNYVTNIKQKSEISLEDRDQKSEKTISVVSHTSGKSVSSATLKSKTLHSDVTIKEETDFHSQAEPNRTSLTFFQKLEMDPNNTTTYSDTAKTTNFMDETVHREMNNIKRELEAIARKFNWKSGKPLAEDKQKSENSLSDNKHGSKTLSTNAPLDSLKSDNNIPRNSELSLADSEQKTEKNIEQLPERPFERESEPELLMPVDEQLQLNENCFKIAHDCLPKHIVRTKCNSSQTTTTLKVEMTDAEGKRHHINATFESSDELQGIIEIDDNSVVHVKLLCGNMFQKSAIGIEKLSDNIVQNYDHGETSNESCKESGKELFQEYNISGVKVCKKKGGIATKAFSVTSVVTEIPMIRSKSSLGMCAEMTEKLRAIVMEMDKKLETPEGKKEVLESLRSLCRFPSNEDVSHSNSCPECCRI